ncbi:hypothetical protein AVEN_22252-1, partial [Araneus ventricosus]
MASFCQVNRITLVLTRHPGTLNDSRCTESSTEVGVLVAITGQGQTPPLG